MGKLFKNISISSMASGLLKTFLPPEIEGEEEGLTHQKLRALNQSSTISRLLYYRSYKEYQEINGGGLYKMADGRYGMVMKISPPPYLEGSIEKNISNFMNSILHDDTVVQFFVFASRNIEHFVSEFDACHPCESNIKNPEVLKELFKNRKEHIVKWSKESMLKTADFKIRDFQNIVSVLFPKDMRLEDIFRQYNELLSNMETYYARNMSAGALTSVVKEILNPGLSEWPIGNDTHRKMNAQMAKGAKVNLNDDGSFSLGDKWIAKTLTTDQFPEIIEPSSYQAALFDPFRKNLKIPLPGPFIMSLTVVFKNTKKQKQKVAAKARWNVSHLSSVPYKYHKKYPIIRDRLKENDEALVYVDKLNEIPLDGMWSLTVFADNKHSMDGYVAQVKKNFADIPGQWRLKEEEFSSIAFQSMIMGLPLQYLDVFNQHLKRFELLFRGNNVSLAPMVSDIKGFGAPVVSYIGGTGQIQSFDPMASSGNYNINVIGPMGSGKSFFTNDLLVSCLGAGYSVRMIDTGYSYKPTCEAIGGQYLQFDKDSSVCMNFFTNIMTEEIEVTNEVTLERETITSIHEDEFSTVVPLIGMMAGIDLSMRDLNETDTQGGLERKNLVVRIEDAINTAYAINGNNSGMHEVLEALVKQKGEAKQQGNNAIYTLLEFLTGALKDYGVETGKYYKYFNGANNVDVDSDYFVLEMEELKQKQNLKNVVSLATLQKFASEAFFTMKPMIIGIDEAKESLENPTFSRALADFATRFRKYNKSLLIISQFVDHFFANKEAQNMFEGSAFKIFLAQEAESIDQAIDKGRISAGTFEKELMKSVKNRKPHFGEFSIRHEGAMAVMRLKVPSFDRWLFSTDPKEKIMRDDVMRRNGFNSLETVKYLEYKTDYPDLEHKELVEKMRNSLGGLSSKAQSQKEEWSVFISNAVNENLFDVYQQPIYNLENKEIEEYEILARITVGSKVEGAMAFIPILKELHLYEHFSKIFLEKIFNKFQYSDNKIAINVDIDNIRNENFLEYFFNKVQTYSIANRLSIEIPMKKYNFDDRILVVDFIEKLKDANIKVVLDNITVDNVDLSLMFDSRPDKVKVDGSVIKLLNEDSEAREKAHTIVSLCNSMTMESVAIHVMNEDVLKMVEKEKFSYAQGYFLGEPFCSSDIEE